MAAGFEDESTEGSYPSVTEADALKFVGKYLLIGITQEDAFGNVVDQHQLHGVIELVAPTGIVISLRGSRQGESYMIPAALDCLEPAEPGNYTLHRTGEIVTNPDYTTVFTIIPPHKH